MNIEHYENIPELTFTERQILGNKEHLTDLEKLMLHKNNFQNMLTYIELKKPNINIMSKEDEFLFWLDYCRNQGDDSLK